MPPSLIIWTLRLMRMKRNSEKSCKKLIGKNMRKSILKKKLRNFIGIIKMRSMGTIITNITIIGRKLLMILKKLLQHQPTRLRVRLRKKKKAKRRRKVMLKPLGENLMKPNGNLKCIGCMRLLFGKMMEIMRAWIIGEATTCLHIKRETTWNLQEEQTKQILKINGKAQPDIKEISRDQIITMIFQEGEIVSNALDPIDEINSKQTKI